MHPRIKRKLIGVTVMGMGLYGMLHDMSARTPKSSPTDVTPAARIYESPGRYRAVDVLDAESEDTLEVWVDSVKPYIHPNGKRVGFQTIHPDGPCAVVTSTDWVDLGAAVSAHRDGSQPMKVAGTYRPVEESIYAACEVNFRVNEDRHAR